MRRWESMEKSSGLRCSAASLKAWLSSRTAPRMERSASIFAGKRPMVVSRVATMFNRVRCIVIYFRLWTYEEPAGKLVRKTKFSGHQTLPHFRLLALPALTLGWIDESLCPVRVFWEYDIRRTKSKYVKLVRQSVDSDYPNS